MSIIEHPYHGFQSGLFWGSAVFIVPLLSVLFLSSITHATREVSQASRRWSTQIGSTSETDAEGGDLQVSLPSADQLKNDPSGIVIGSGYASDTSPGAAWTPGQESDLKPDMVVSKLSSSAKDRVLAVASGEGDSEQANRYVE